MSWAQRNLQYDIASFDFYTWLVLVKARGAKGIVFNIDNPKTTKWPVHEVMRRFHSIIEPGPEFAGLPSRIGYDGELGFANPSISEQELIAHINGGGKFELLRSVLPPRDVEYTVTIRDETRMPSRNSNVDAWRRFAAQIGALVIEDYGNQQIDIRERFALYAGARMNFGVVNGPMNFASLGGCPVAIFRAIAQAPSFRRFGIEVGGRYPWMGPNQWLVWEEDAYDNLMRWFDEWKAAASHALSLLRR